MAINGNISLFRLTDAISTSETAVTDKIEFDNDNVIPDSKSHILGMRPVFAAIETDNTNPGSQDPVKAQDTGNFPLIIELTGYFNEKAGDALGIATFRNWMRTAKVIKTLYPRGRMGLRNNIRPEFNVLPASTGGYRLVAFELDERYEFLGIVPFVCRLRFDGLFTLVGL